MVQVRGLNWEGTRREKSAVSAEAEGLCARGREGLLEDSRGGACVIALMTAPLISGGKKRDGGAKVLQMGQMEAAAPCLRRDRQWLAA